MIERHVQITFPVVVLLSASMLASCAPRPPRTPQSAPAQSETTAELPSEPEPNESAPVATSTPSAPPVVAVVAPPPPDPPVPRTQPHAIEFAEHAALKDIYFGPGRADIGRDGARALEATARWLKTNEDYLLLIEGHSDSQGTREANLAVAERRANAALNYLLKQGVLPSRMIVVSYGADRPACMEKTGACMAKNRRVHFLVKGQ
jgi:outer membrane protein OmpA-like peptidoglycan-associated protein